MTTDHEQPATRDHYTAMVCTTSPEPAPWDVAYAAAEQHLEDLTNALIGLGPLFGDPIVGLLLDKVQAAIVHVTAAAVAEHDANVAEVQRLERQLADLSNWIHQARRWCWTLNEHLGALVAEAEQRRARTRPDRRRHEPALSDAYRAIDHGRLFTADLAAYLNLTSTTPTEGTSR